MWGEAAIMEVAPTDYKVVKGGLKPVIKVVKGGLKPIIKAYGNFADR